MKRSFKTMLGVTLLEIMLVLAIAAMVIVMSIRYYQQASSNQRVASVVDMVTGIIAAGQVYLNGNGYFSGIASTNITPYMPGNVMPKSPWGSGSLSVGSGGPSSYVISIPAIPAPDCQKVKDLLKGQTNIAPGSCGPPMQITVNSV